MAKPFDKTIILLAVVKRIRKILEKIENKLQCNVDISLCKTCLCRNNCYLSGLKTNQCNSYIRDKQT